LSQVAEKNQSLCDVVSGIADVVCKRADNGLNYGVVLIPEGLIDFIPEVSLAALDCFLCDCYPWKAKSAFFF
jgi:hypothetical protein